MGIEQEFWAAFIEAQKAMPVIGKNRTANIETRGGGSYSYRFADLNDVIAAVSPVLHANRLGFAQPTVSTASGVGVSTLIAHDNGYTVSFGELTLPAGDDARAAGSALTYARRYSLLAALGLSADTDDDGAQVSDVRSHASEGTGGSSAGPTPSCPDCGGNIYDNRETNIHRLAEGKKAMPAAKCRSCKWHSWGEEFFDGTPIREDGTPQEFNRETGEVLWPSGQEPFE